MAKWLVHKDIFYTFLIKYISTIKVGLLDLRYVK